MIIIDEKLKKLQRQQKPIKVGMLGAGFMARGIALQISRYTPGMELVAVVNRTPQKATQMLEQIQLDSSSLLVTDDYHEMLKEGVVDVVVEATGTIDYALDAMLASFAAGNHVVSMNAEVDATVGNALAAEAAKAGVVYTLSDGDQPGVEMNLYRYVVGLGLRPVLCGNVKGLHDPYRTPITQAAFAKKWGQTPHMVTSFADGTKISFEQACVANATGMGVAKRGMMGPVVEYGTPIEETVRLYPLEELTNGSGIVDYVVGAVPNGGVFILAMLDKDPIQQHYLNYYKLGEGPLYCFFAPNHLCHLETPKSIARVALFEDPTLHATATTQSVEVITRLKKDMKAGESLDTFGGYTMYGECENYQTARADHLLPIGLAEGAVVTRDLPKDAYVRLDDVTVAKDKTIEKLWKKQNLLLR